MRTHADYRAALARAEALFDLPEEPDPASELGAFMDALVTLIEACERKHFPVEASDPVDAIKFRMEQQGLTPADLQPMIGRLNRVYEVLNRKRPLTLAMMRRLNAQMGIPAEALLGRPEK
ncbi:MAG: helix-turn-helix domain-containing protein [Rubrivivax sp.]